MNEKEIVYKKLDDGELVVLDNKILKIVIIKENNLFKGKIYQSSSIGKIESYSCSIDPIEESTFEGSALEAVDYFYDLAVLIIEKEKELTALSRKYLG